MADRLEVIDPREQRLSEVVGAYLEAADAGWAPDPESLYARYPDLAEDLQAFFVAQSAVAALAYPCPSSAQRRDREAGGSSSDGALTVYEGSKRAPVEANAVGDYESLTLIKAGGMGSVFKAWQKGAKRWVALKKIKAGRFASRADVRRFRDEAEAAANLDHPHIVPIYEVGEHQGEPFFSMKLFEHGTLQQHLERYQKDPRGAAKLLATVARAVHFAHQRGILHRDLKPANILLDAQEQPYVADFGLAKRLRPYTSEPIHAPAPQGPQPPTVHTVKTAQASGVDIEDFTYLAPEQTGQAQADESQKKDQGATVTADGEGHSVTRFGTFVGTQGYVPPEHASTTKEGTSTAADVYSLGAILYKMLTGRKLFAAANLYEAVRLIHESMPDSPRSLNPRVDVRLEAICLKCIEKDPKKRYASAEALAEDLDRWLKGEPPLAWPLPWRLRAWRATKRYVLPASLAMVFGFAMAAVFFVYYYFDDARVPAALEAKAKKGRVVLIGDTGQPVWSRWNVGEGTVMVSPDRDKPFSFTTQEKGRLELLPKVRLARYRFSAQVRHDVAFGDGVVGIYFGHHTTVTDDAIKRYWSDLVFSDNGPRAKSQGGPKEQVLKQAKYGKVGITLDRHAFPRGHSARTTDAFLFFESAEGTAKAPDWRRLVIEVTPDHVKAFWEGKSLPTIDRGELRKLAQPLMFGDEVVIPEFQFGPEGALGLYVWAGRASFRQVTVEPLD